MHTVRYITLSVATVDTPASHTMPALTHLVGCAMLVTERNQAGRWGFRLLSATADDGEAGLLDWLGDHLPAPATVIGWQIGDRLLPALLDAAAHAEAPLAHRFASTCARVFTAPCIDLALDHGGGAAPPFTEVADRAGLAVETMTEDATFSAWSFSSLEGVQRHLEQESIALWQLWLAQQCAHCDAIPATADWLARRG